MTNLQIRFAKKIMIYFNESRMNLVVFIYAIPIFLRHGNTILLFQVKIHQVHMVHKM